MREGYFNKAHTEAKRECMDYIWYMWCGEDSPLFGKKKMTTFERYFIDDKTTHKEEKNPYYTLRNEESVCEHVLEAFGLDPKSSHIVNGHVPVKVVKGESPIKANGRLFVIDGGFSKAYQKETGIAGYTLIYNSHGMVLVSHEPFVSTDRAIGGGKGYPFLYGCAPVYTGQNPCEGYGYREKATGKYCRAGKTALRISERYH